MESKSQTDTDVPSKPTPVEAELEKYSPTPDDNRRVVIISFFYLAVALFIGVPVWLKTTATYQAPLPFWEINSLSSRQIDIRVRVNVLSLTNNVGPTQLTTIQRSLQHSEDPSVRCGSGMPNSKRLQLGCTVHTKFIKQPTWLAQLASESSTGVNTFTSRLEDSLFNTSAEDHSHSFCTEHDPLCAENTSAYTFVVLPESVRPSWSKTSDTPVIPSASHVRNLAFVFAEETQQDGVELAKQIGRSLNSVLLSVSRIQLDSVPRPNSNSESVRPPSTLAHLPASSVYDITVTILTNHLPTRSSATGTPRSQPGSADLVDQLLTDPTTWLETHVGLAFAAWLPHVRFVFHSQRLHAVDIERAVRSRLNGNQTYRYYTREDLSNLVNYLESYLGAPQTTSARTKDLASTKPGLHLILLLQQHQLASSGECPPPLRFHLATTGASEPAQPLTVTSVATVPQWGGLFSIESTQCSSQSNASGDRLGQQMVAIIHELLGLTELRHQDRTNKQSIDVARWELDAWFLHRTVESLFSLRATMIALVDLLARFPNMVINDVVAGDVEQAVRVWSAVLDDWQSSNVTVGFGQAFTKSQTALNAINNAFFDHTLLGRLYFQEDQKFGIYVPLFVPIGISLLATAKNVFRILYPS